VLQQAVSVDEGAKKAGLFMTVDENSTVRYVRFDRLQNMMAESIQLWAKKTLHDDCHLVTDGYSSLLAVAPVNATHTLWSFAQVNPVDWIVFDGSIRLLVIRRQR
jgi:hypothetical protein